MRKINEKGLNLIKKFEGYSAKPYLCPAKIPTIGYGTTYYPNGAKVKITDFECSEVAASLWLAHEIDDKAKVIENYLTQLGLELNDNEFSALVVFAYNLGVGPIIEGGRSVNTALKSKNKMAIADSLLLYNKITKSILGIPRKVELKGLTIRRNAERELFLLPIV